MALPINKDIALEISKKKAKEQIAKKEALNVKKETEYIYVDKIVPEYIFVGGKYPTIEDTEYIRKPKRSPQKAEPKQKLKPSSVIEINSLHKDAIQCLISLGMKKSEASKKVSSMMSVKNYSTIEDFLMDVYKK